MKDVNNDYATINITMNGIKIPYSYTLYNEFNEEILQEDGVYTTELNFGYKVKTGGGEYEYTEKTKISCFEMIGIRLFCRKH